MGNYTGTPINDLSASEVDPAIQNLKPKLATEHQSDNVEELEKFFHAAQSELNEKKEDMEDVFLEEQQIKERISQYKEEHKTEDLSNDEDLQAMERELKVFYEGNRNEFDEHNQLQTQVEDLRDLIALHERKAKLAANPVEATAASTESTLPLPETTPPTMPLPESSEPVDLKAKLL